MNLDEIRTASAASWILPFVLSAAPMNFSALQVGLDYRRLHNGRQGWETPGTVTASSQTLSTESEDLLYAMLALTSELLETSKDLDPDIAAILQDRFHELL